MVVQIDPDEITPTTISNFIQTQFPAFFRQNGPMFIKFLQAYYQWLEQPGNPLYYSRRYLAIQDIDTTLDEFLIHFKEKYLKNIQLNTESNTRLLVKHALDIYRSKGTEQCVELLFQLVFDQSVKFYYPSQDLFKVSDGQWYLPNYFELTLSENNILLVNKEVVGVFSGAKAFVSDVVRIIANGRLVDVAYISAVVGTFQNYEKIQPVDGSVSIDLCPSIAGSLNSVLIADIGSGNNYTNGDNIMINSTFGTGGGASVSNTTTISGQLSIALGEGGFGYSNTANLYVSNTELVLTDLQITNYGTKTYGVFKETITQPLVAIQYTNATGSFTVGDNVFVYSNNVVTGTGAVMKSTQTSTTTGNLVCSLLSGSLNGTIYNTGNVVAANLVANGYTIVNATGTFIGNADQVTLTLDNTAGFARGEIVCQGDNYGTVNTIANNALNLYRVNGMFRRNVYVLGQSTNASGNVTNIGMTMGLVSNTNVFYGDVIANNVVSGQNFTARCTVADTTGAGLTVSVANSYLYTENVQYNTDTLSTYSTVLINANTYGFPANPTANLTSGTIASCWSFANLTIGKVSSLLMSGNPTGYFLPPIITLDQKAISDYFVHNDVGLSYTSTTGSYVVGEIVTQAATNAYGTVMPGSNSSVIYIERDKFYPNNDFVTTTNSTTTVVGALSGVSGNVTLLETNKDSPIMGRNLISNVHFVTGNGVLLNILFQQSGFGFQNGESVTLASSTSNTAQGTAVIGPVGTGNGYYRKKGGFLSDEKKLYDGIYYQNFSYEVISALTIDKYQQLLRNITHPTGTAMFGRLMHSTVIDSGGSSVSNTIVKLA